VPPVAFATVWAKVTALWVVLLTLPCSNSATTRMLAMVLVSGVTKPWLR
jgi:hypothetical protein